MSDCNPTAYPTTTSMMAVEASPTIYPNNHKSYQITAAPTFASANTQLAIGMDNGLMLNGVKI